MSKEFELSVRIDDASDIRDHYEGLSPEAITTQSLDRRIYKDGRGMMARTTRMANDDEAIAHLDFKEDTPDGVTIKNVLESKPIELDDAPEASVAQLLGQLGYDLHIQLEKQRTSYVFDEFQVDIDEYTHPEVATVFEIEGQPDAVRAEHQRLQDVGLLPAA